MPSSFSGVVRSVVRELDRTGELIPVDSLRSSTSFQPYCLVSRKPSTSWFWRSRYTSVNLSIRDILDPNAPEPGVQCRGPFHFHDTMDGRVQGSVELAAPGQGRIKGGATVSGSSSASMDVFTLRVDPSTWETLHKERRLRQPEHKILQQLRNRGDNVYVVTEALQTQKEVEVTRTHKQEGSGQFALPGVTCLQGEGQGHLSRKKTVTIPSGSILAFQVAKLVIGPDWDILLLPDKKQRTFQKPPAAHKPTSRRADCLCSLGLPLLMDSIQQPIRFLSDGPTEERAVVTKDFAGLRAEVEPQAQELENLSKELRQEMLGALGRLLLDTPALQDLEEALEQGLCCGRVEPRDGPVGTVLECLVLPSQELVKDLAIPVFYLLGALTALSETQHLLVAQALETRALPRQLELVGSVLKQSSPWQEPRAVSLPPGLLGSSWGEDAPAWVLLEECGLELQVGPPQACWDPEAQGHTCALYAALALLLRLGQEPC
ncbi:gasdermin-D isoform X1 [Loxodonta africana]|uniref:gasdermin-D isoform X1 n=2 Tax=Loxodonta africana TaxID=9785 RepID=UPI00054061EE|nr:gasdermin-D isoform X1 [Loxodonta africana]XP_010600015.1 gasdermin-D isoform X1 [Loxodonta africana]